MGGWAKSIWHGQVAWFVQPLAAGFCEQYQNSLMGCIFHVFMTHLLAVSMKFNTADIVCVHCPVSVFVAIANL